MFAFQWREFSPPFKLRPQTPPIDKREICNSKGTVQFLGNAEYILLRQTSPRLPTRAISQWARSLEWRHAVTLHTAGGKNCIIFFPFSCEASSLYLVLWLCSLHVFCDTLFVFVSFCDSYLPQIPLTKYFQSVVVRIGNRTYSVFFCYVLFK